MATIFVIYTMLLPILQKFLHFTIGQFESQYELYWPTEYGQLHLSFIQLGKCTAIYLQYTEIRLDNIRHFARVRIMSISNCLTTKISSKKESKEIIHCVTRRKNKSYNESKKTNRCLAVGGRLLRRVFAASSVLIC